MTTPDRGDVFFVPFIFTDGSAAKNRPAVIVSSADYHSSRRDVVIAGVTSNLSRTEFAGQASIQDWRACGLTKPSVVSGIIMTIRDTKLGRRLGTLSATDQGALDSALRKTLGL